MNPITIVFIALIYLGYMNNSYADNSALSETTEISFLKETFQKFIGQGTKTNILIQEKYLIFLEQDALEKLKAKGIKESQYFLYADRNPKKQLFFIFFFDGQNQKIVEIGRSFISTGNPKRKGHFLTPTGIFENSTDNFSYRSEGVKNDKGLMGLGKKGSRVWDFGWQETSRKINKRKEKYLIRLLIHSSDPIFGESRLGLINSKGCVRIPAKLNEFLDKFGIIDKNYENKFKEKNISKRINRILRKDRQSVIYAGKYLIIGDSSKHPAF